MTTAWASRSERSASRPPLARGPAIALWLPVGLLVAGGLASAFVGAWASGGSDAATFVLTTVITLLYGSIGALVTARQPDNVVGRLLWLIGVLVGLVISGSTYAVWSATAFDGRLPGAVLAGWLTQWAISPILVIALVLLPLLFPDGRVPSARWRWARAFVLVWVAIVGLPDMLQPGNLGPTPVANPTAWPGDPALLDALGVVNTVCSVPAFVLVLWSSVVRYRRGTSVERAQLRWFGAVAVLAIASIAAATFAPDPVSVFGFLGALVAIALFPVAIGIAILRYRLYAIDRLVSRTISWAIVSLSLVAVFAGLVIALQAALTGVTQGETLAVAASTLAAFAIFQPLRRRVQAAVDRRFNRARVDAEAALAALAVQLRDETDLERVAGRVEAAANGALAPAGVALWTRDR